MSLDQFGFADISLMSGERGDSVLSLSEDGSLDLENGPEVMLLTDRRVIHLHGKPKHRKATFTSIQDITGIEITTHREGFSAFAWAGLSFLVAALLYVVIDNTLGRILAAIAVAMMGIYLVVDRMLSPGNQLLTFKAGGSQLICELKSARSSDDIYPFINRLFLLKEVNGRGAMARAQRFARR